MVLPYVGELMLVGFNFAPPGWMFCDGRLLPISENETLFQLIGTTYGGDGESTFALPDLRGRVVLHQGQGPGISQNYQMGEVGGVETVTLTTQQIPVHNHQFGTAGTDGDAQHPDSNLLGDGQQIYNDTGDTAPMGAGACGPAGGSQPHENMAPYLAMNWIISLFGVFPQQN